MNLVRCYHSYRLILRASLALFGLATGLFPGISGGASPVPEDRPAHYPAWWFEFNVVQRINPQNEYPSWLGGDYPVPNDYAAANSGQLKYIAKKACEYLDQKLPGGAGTAVHDLLDSFGINLTQLPGVTASQSSTDFGGEPGRAIDNNTDGEWGDESVTHTSGEELNPWWQVNLGSARTIRTIELWNRTDCCGDRTKNFYVFVGQQDMSQRTLADLLADPAVWKSAKITADPSPNVLINVGAFAGQFVMVRIDGTEYLHLAEVKVNGAPGNATNVPDDFAAINAGQIKAVAKPFYDRLLAEGYNTNGAIEAAGNSEWAFDYPWNPDTPAVQNLAAANLGQVKMAFSFDLEALDLLAKTKPTRDSYPGDRDGDGVSDEDELLRGTNPDQKDNPSVHLEVFGFATP